MPPDSFSRNIVTFITIMTKEYDIELLALRPLVEVHLNGEKNEHEQFMHETLRPILKQNHEKIVALITASKHFNRNLILQKPITERHIFLKNLLNKNVALKNQLIGIVLAFFTSTELNNYISHSTEINKRINEMVIVRFISEL